MGSNLPPITRGLNSTIPDYMANADTLFQGLIKTNERLARNLNVIGQYAETAEIKNPVVHFDTRDLAPMTLLLEDGPDLENQIRQMRDDFYSGEPARKKPWLDMMYDEFDKGLLVRFDPSKPEEVSKMMPLMMVSQALPIKLLENPDYTAQRYPTHRDRLLCDQRLSHKQTIDPLVTLAIQKNYGADGKKFAPDDKRLDVWEAHELGLMNLEERVGYVSKAGMNPISSLVDDRFMYPAAERALAEYEAAKTGVMAPVHITIPAEFSFMLGFPPQVFGDAQFSGGKLGTALKDFTTSTFTGLAWPESALPAGERVLIDGVSARDLAKNIFPNATEPELDNIVPAVITSALSSGKHKLAMVHIFESENHLFQAHPVPLEPDLCGVFTNPETCEHVMLRQAKANQNPFSPEEQERYQKTLDRLGTQLLSLSTVQREKQISIQLLADTLPERNKIEADYQAKVEAVTAPARAALAKELAQIKLPHYSQTGVAPTAEIRLSRDSFQPAPSRRNADPLNSHKGVEVDSYSHVTEQFAELFSVKTTPTGVPLNIYNTILIDGKSVSEMVDERFPNHPDREDLSEMCSVTLATAIASGEHQISTFTLVSEKGLLQVQEQPIKVDVSAAYPSRREELGWFRATLFDWGPFKAPPTKGELAQQKQDALLTRPLTDVQQADKERTLQAFHAAITAKSSERAISSCFPKEAVDLTTEKAAMLLRQMEAVKLVVKERVDQWKSSLDKPYVPEKSNPQKEAKTQKIEKSNQAEKSADKQMPM